MIPEVIKETISLKLARLTGSKVSVFSAVSVGGGSINQAVRLKTNAGTYFVKFNDKARYPLMFEREMEGLALLRDTGTVEVPVVAGCGLSGNYSYLLMHFIERGAMQNNYWETAGRQLAQLHQCTSAAFGLSNSNYMGSLQQSNRQHASWSDFLITERLQPMAHAACKKGILEKTDLDQLEKCYLKFQQGYFPEEAPALLHGDLWNGNLITGSRGLPVFIDPAVYYGHREMDIAMTLLFGGFPQAFYDAYHQEFPLEKEWKQRMAAAQLYPLLVHCVLFGSGYTGQLRAVLQQI